MNERQNAIGGKKSGTSIPHPLPPPGTNIRQDEGGRWAMAMIVESFNEGWIEGSTESIEARRAAARLRTNMGGVKGSSVAKQDPAGPNWSSWFSHSFGNKETEGQVKE